MRIAAIQGTDTAKAVRISAGYPFFFPPVALKDAATGQPGALVDGGVTSRFPIFLFDVPKPTRPTWGFFLYDGLPDGGKIPVPNAPIKGLLWPVKMLQNIIDTATNSLDDFEMQAFGDRIIAIPTNSPTLDFSLSVEQKNALYNDGYDAATQFFAGNPSGANRFGVVPS